MQIIFVYECKVKLEFIYVYVVLMRNIKLLFYISNVYSRVLEVPTKS